MRSVKQAARELIDGGLPESASWNDLMYELYAKQKIEEGLKELEEGQGIPHEDVKRRLLGDPAYVKIEWSPRAERENDEQLLQVVTVFHGAQCLAGTEPPWQPPAPKT